MKKPNIIHVRFFKFSVDGEIDFYFGSLSAIYDYFHADEIGVSLKTLFGKFAREKEFVTSNCIIKKGELIRKKNAKKPRHEQQ